MNSNYSDGIIDEWAKQAMEDMGDKSWRDIDTNSLVMIVYAVQKTRNMRLVKKVTKPLWWLIGVLGAGSVWMIVTDVFQVVH